MMANETVKMAAETKKFMNALDAFYGWEPRNLYDFLLLFYFAKERKLSCVENLDADEHYDFKFSYEEVKEDKEAFWEFWTDMVCTSDSVFEKWKDMKNFETAKSAFLYFVKSKGIECPFVFDKNIVSNAPEGLKDVLAEVVRALAPDVDAEADDAPFYVMEEVATTLISLSDEWYAANFEWAFGEILRSIKKVQKNKGTMLCLPKGMAKLMCSLMDAKSGSVYAPYEYVGEVALNLPVGMEYYGNGASMESWGISLINILLHGRPSDGLHYDGMLEWKGDAFDYILAMPTFPARPVSSYVLSTISHSSLTSYDLIEKVATDAKCKSVGMYLDRFCFGQLSNQDSAVKKLLENDWLETVVLLPAGLFDGTNVSTVIFVTNKNKAVKETVKLVDASKCFTQISGKRKFLDVEEVLSLVKEGDGRVIQVSVKDIEDNNYIVYPPYYINREVACEQGMHLMTLSECLEILPCKYSQQATGLRFSFYRRNTDASEFVVKASELEMASLDKFAYSSVDEDCLLWTQSSKQFVYLQTDGLTVNVRKGTKAFKINSDIVNPQYLLAELYKDYFVKQLNRFGADSWRHARFMKSEDFLSLKIQVPNTVLDQDKLVACGKEALLEKRVSMLASKYEERFEDFILGQRQRKHAVAQVLNEIMPSVDIIKDYVETHENITKDSIVSKRSGKTLNEYLVALQNLTIKVAGMVDKFTADENFSPSEEVNLYDFMPEYVKSKSINEIFGISFTPAQEDFDSFMDYGEGNTTEKPSFNVKVSRSDLTQMLDNLVANAKVHGFIDNKQHYGIVICLSRNNENHNGMGCISVCNDGKLVSESIDLSKIFTWGVGHGSGIGCWQVKNIAEHFGGTVRYEEDEKSPYPCSFDIYLPLIED